VELFDSIILHSNESDKPFVLIGGHAVNFYGFSRQTGDIDFIVNSEDKSWWVETLGKLKYSVFQDDQYFTRFKPSTLGEWPIDLMYVSSDTFQKMLDQSVVGDVGFATLQVISARHLITLKIHAISSGQKHRYLKDYLDIAWLLDNKKSDLNADELKELCIKYADISLYNKLNSDCSL